jgi:hypothetical protein
MSRSGSIRRLAFGAALGCAAVGSAPALAGASPCTYNPTTKVASVVDSSGVNQLRVGVNGTQLFTQDGGNPAINCAGGGTVATTANTDRVNVFAQAKGASDGVVLDQSRGAFAPGATLEADGNSEIELALSGQSGHLAVFGTPAADVIRVRSADRLTTIGAITFGADSDDDVTFTASDVVLAGGDGADTLSGQGYSFFGDEARLPLGFSGGAGDDTIIGGLGVDHFSGNAGNDTLQTADGNPELVSGGPDVDTAVRDGGDILSTVESSTLGSVGRLALSPRRVTTDARKRARMTLRWTHPKTWRDLRRVEVRLYRGTEQVGTLELRPRDTRVAAASAAVRIDARVTHTAKTLTARLAMTFPSVPTGASLRLAVEATDLRGHTQIERDAGRIRIG